MKFGVGDDLTIGGQLSWHEEQRLKHAAERRLKWDQRFLRLAREVAGWSLDPSTKTGAVLVDPDRRVLALGYNGFARGVADLPERYVDRTIKYPMVVHCEVNCLLDAGRLARGSTLYTYPFQSCARCAALVVQAGVARCVAPPLPADKAERWAEDMALATTQFREAGVVLDLVPLEDAP